MSMMQRIRRHPGRLIALGMFLCLLIFTGILFYRSKYCLKNTMYSLQSAEISAPIWIVQLTDLHDSTFGTENRTLVELVSKQQPDLIFITGDLLNANIQRTDIATKLISDLCEIAPVYVSQGNHEQKYQKQYGVDILAAYRAAGATVLEKQYVDVTVNGQQLRIGGIYGYCHPPKYFATGEADSEEYTFLTDFQNTDAYTMLLCHLPLCWLQSSSLENWDIDCVFSGHVHGGQIILPGGCGVYAPDMGWFPGKLRGVYTSSDGSSNLVLSAGLGNTEWVPRFHNVPEIVTVELLPESAA